MELLEIIKNRRAVYPTQYIDKEVPDALIRELLQAANWAPSHKKTEPWRFKVLKGKSQQRLGEFLARKYKEITPVKKYTDFKYNKLVHNPQKAGAIIAICMQRDPKARVPEWEEIAATAMAVQNMWLLASERGVGAYWSSPSLIAYADEFFDFEEGERCLGFFYLGYYKGALDSGKRNEGSLKVTWV